MPGYNRRKTRSILTEILLLRMHRCLSNWRNQLKQADPPATKRSNSGDRSANQSAVPSLLEWPKRYPRGRLNFENRLTEHHPLRHALLAALFSLLTACPLGLIAQKHSNMVFLWVTTNPLPTTRVGSGSLFVAIDRKPGGAEKAGTNPGS